MNIGYVRPYADDEQCRQQLQALSAALCEYVIEEEHAGPKRRVQLEQLMAELKTGDKVVVARLFALADSTRHLMELLDQLDKQQAHLYSIHENIDTSLANGASFKDIVGLLLEFQSDVISQRTKSGLHEAREKGNSAGRPRKPDHNVQRAIMMYQSKQYTLAQIKEETGISKSTLYRYLEQ